MASTRPRYNSVLERRRYLVTQQCTTSFAQPSILVQRHILPWICTRLSVTKIRTNFFLLFLLFFFLSNVRHRVRDSIYRDAIGSFTSPNSWPASLPLYLLRSRIISRFRPCPFAPFSSPFELLSSSGTKIASAAMPVDSRYGFPTIFIVDFKTAEHSARAISTLVKGASTSACHLAVSRETVLYACQAHDRQIASWHVQSVRDWSTIGVESRFW